MANVWNDPLVTASLLSGGVDIEFHGMAAWWRVAQPQPFQFGSPVTPTPSSGQIWPRGTSQG